VKNGKTRTADAVENADQKVKELVNQFINECQPLETEDKLLLLVDERTGASHCECHILGSRIVALGTTEVPLDPEDQPDYKANREIEEGSVVFQKMKEDAKLRRSFSNIVAEWKKESDSKKPLQIIGGQHRFEAIRHAVETQVDVYHGMKVYFALDMPQRLDVQLISNTNIDVSGDLIDRLRETGKGSRLRDWCHAVGLLKDGSDFTDSYMRSGPISVRMATTFITNYFSGKTIDAEKFASLETIPMVYKPGGSDELWEKTKNDHPKLWSDEGLSTAAKEFAALNEAQRRAFTQSKRSGQKAKADYPEKAMNLAILSAWAYVAGILHNNPVRLKRHFDLKNATNHDPLNAAQLATGRHYTDPPNYRGLGYRYDPQERGRFVELFFIQADDGKGITKSSIDIAIKKYHAKRGQLDVLEAEAKAKGN
jgi:hypothetical protein